MGRRAVAPGRPGVQNPASIGACNFRHYGDANFSIFILQLSPKGACKKRRWTEEVRCHRGKGMHKGHVERNRGRSSSYTHQPLFQHLMLENIHDIGSSY